METLSMNGLVVAAAAILAGLAILVSVLRSDRRRPSRHPYQKHLDLFSADDQAFYRALRQAVGDDYEIFGKIRVSDVILPRKGSTRMEARFALDPLAEHHFDFVLCDKKNLMLVCAIQLTDKTNPARKPNRDDPVKMACEAVSLPFSSIHIQAEYRCEELREKLLLTMSKEPLYLMESDGRREPHISNLDDMKF